VCPQKTKIIVDTKTEILKIRISKNLKTKIKELSEAKGMSASEMTRKLWQNYFEKAEQTAWQKEVANW